QALAPREHAIAHRLVQGLRPLGLGRQEAVEGHVHRGRPLLHVGAQVEAHARSSSARSKGVVFSTPLSSRVSSSMRFSASSRYLPARRASPPPSSNTSRDSSRERFPASS